MTRYAKSLAIAVVLTFALALPASASADQIGLSRDRVTWTGHLKAPLFDPAARWVPGDRRIESFFVRNHSSSDGEVAIELHNDSIIDLLNTGDVEIAVKVDGGKWNAISDPDSHPVLASAISMASGQHRRVRVRVTFDKDSTNQSQALSLDLGFTTRLTQAGLPASPQGQLAATGGPSAWLVLTSAALALAGWFLVRTSRTKGTHDA